MQPSTQIDIAHEEALQELSGPPIADEPLPEPTLLEDVIAEPLAESEPVALTISDEAPLPPLPPLEDLAPSASPTLAAMPPHAEITIKAWFVDTFTNLVATGRLREREVEALLQDLLLRLGLRS